MSLTSNFLSANTSDAAPAAFQLPSKKIRVPASGKNLAGVSFQVFRRGGLHQLCFSSEILFNQNDKVPRERSKTPRQAHCAADILSDALDLACESEDELSAASDYAVDEELPVKFEAVSVSEDYYGNRKLPRQISSCTTASSEKRDLLMDDLRSFEDMLAEACSEKEDPCDTSCSSYFEEDDFEIPIEFEETCPSRRCSTGNINRSPSLAASVPRRSSTGSVNPKKIELVLDNMQAFRATLDAYRNRHNMDDYNSCSSDEEDSFVGLE